MKKYIIFRIILFINFIIAAIMGIILFNKWIYNRVPLWLWIFEGTIIGFSILLSIIRGILLLRNNIDKDSVYYGHPVFGSIIFVLGLAVFSFFIVRDSSIDKKKDDRAYDVIGENRKMYNSYGMDIYIAFDENDYCKEEHSYNTQYVMHFLEKMTIYDGDRSKDVNHITNPVLFTIEFGYSDDLTRFTFYRDTPWVEYSSSKGDILPTYEYISIKMDMVQIEELYSYLIENHEDLHKKDVEEKQKS